MRIPHHFRASVLCAAVLGLVLAVASGCSNDEGLTVKRLSRSSAPPGDWITIFGSGFQSDGAKGVRVYFGDQQAKQVHIDGDDKLKVEVPGAPDTTGKIVDIKVIFEPGGELTYPNAFKYVQQAETTVDDLVSEQK